jgi:hypothetical protein
VKDPGCAASGATTKAHSIAREVTHLRDVERSACNFRRPVLLRACIRVMVLTSPPILLNRR